MGRTFSWLHFTDLHWGAGAHKHNWGTIHDELLKDIKRLQPKCGEHWDAVFFTGDLANKGKKDEFQGAVEWLERLRTALQSAGSTPVFLAVPGNHDLVRPKPKSGGMILLSCDKRDKILQMIWDKTKIAARKTIDDAFAVYSKQIKMLQAAWNEKNPLLKGPLKDGILPGDFAASLEKDGVRIGVVGLNSAFLQLQEGDYSKRLVCAPAQLTELLGIYDNWSKEHHLCLLLTHHPHTWLDKKAEEDFLSEIARPGRFALHLCGHQHEAYIAQWTHGGGSEMRRLFMACSLFGREEYEIWNKGIKEVRSDRRHGYCAGVVEFFSSEARLRLFPRVAEQRGGNSWGFDRDTKQHLDQEKDDGGTELISIPLQKGVSPPPPDPPPPPSSSIHDIVKRSMAKLLAGTGLAPLTKALVEMIQQELPGRWAQEADPAQVLVETPFRDSFRILNMAVRDCLTTLQRDQSAAKINWDGGASIMGWLVLLSVDEKWLESFLESSTDQEIVLEIPVQTQAGAEIIISRIDGAKAEFIVGGKGFQILGRRGTCCSHLPESGFVNADNISVIKRLLWKKLYQEEPTTPITPDIDEELNKALQYRQEMRESPYLVVDIHDVTINHQVLVQLRKDLPALRQVFLCGSGKKKALVFSPLDETDMKVRLDAFFRTSCSKTE